ncbi:MAG: acyltransferase [Proteobacteria bacterium]|nr:acyltransferase [Pseudomonadota bacterium]
MHAREGGYVPALTGLRGVAAWWVVLYHFADPLIDLVPTWVLSLVRHGYLAVDLFFILSGYVIYITSGQSLRAPARFVVFRFILNRLIRIYPLHLVMMFVYLANPLALWLFSSSGVGDGRYDWDYYVASIFLVQNWGWFERLQWNVPAWSISTEFAAYLFCPLLITFGVARLSTNVYKLIFAILFLAIFIGLIFNAAGAQSIGEKISSLGLMRCLIEFCMGLCLGAIGCVANTAGGMFRFSNSLTIIALMGVFVLLMNYFIPNYWFVPIVFVVLIYILSRGDVLFSRILSSAWIHYLGLISYSTYLVHFFVKDWVKFFSESIGFGQLVLYVLACLVASMVLYKYVEGPSRSILRRKLSKREMS